MTFGMPSLNFALLSLSGHQRIAVNECQSLRNALNRNITVVVLETSFLFFEAIQERAGKSKRKMSSAREEVVALEALRDSSSELVKHLDAMNEKLDLLNQQNERKCDRK